MWHSTPEIDVGFHEEHKFWAEAEQFAEQSFWLILSPTTFPKDLCQFLGNISCVSGREHKCKSLWPQFVLFSEVWNGQKPALFSVVNASLHWQFAWSTRTLLKHVWACPGHGFLPTTVGFLFGTFSFVRFLRGTVLAGTFFVWYSFMWQTSQTCKSQEDNLHYLTRYSLYTYMFVFICML